MRTRSRVVLVLSAVALCAAVSFWAAMAGTRAVDKSVTDAFLVLELPPGSSSVTRTFATSRAAEKLYVAAQPSARSERLHLSITANSAPISFKGPITGVTRFAIGHDVAAGSFTVMVRQEEGHRGGLVVITDHEPPHRITPWQIVSRVYVGVLVLAGIWALVAAVFASPRQRALSMRALQVLMLGFVAIFTYLLFHEGGHALGEIWFGRYSFAQSDFWGVCGHPHSGGVSGPALAPWQQTIIIGGGPMLPTFAGWALFFAWRSRFVREHRRKRPIANLYFSAIVAVLVFPSIVLAGCLLGLISDNETEAVISGIRGPAWFVHAVLWSILVVNAFILCRVAPEFWKIARGLRA